MSEPRKPLTAGDEVLEGYAGRWQARHDQATDGEVLFVLEPHGKLHTLPVEQEK